MEDAASDCPVCDCVVPEVSDAWFFSQSWFYLQWGCMQGCPFLDHTDDTYDFAQVRGGVELWTGQGTIRGPGLMYDGMTWPPYGKYVGADSDYAIANKWAH